MESKRITDAEVLGYELRGNPLRHHVYMVRLRWSTELVTVVYRRYSQFFDFQCRLLDMFPKEAGLNDYKERIIPFIPGKVLFGQSLKTKTVEYRRHALNTYCQRLVRLPANISQCRLVHEFFETRDSDLKHLTAGASGGAGQKKASSSAQISTPLHTELYFVVADYTRQTSGECSLTAGSQVEVIDKKDTGWWFVQSDDAEQGWVPATYLELQYDSVNDADGGSLSAPAAEEPESYVCSNDYSATNADELSLQRGVIVEVIKKYMNGWWTIRCNGKVGLGPAACVVKANSRKAKAVLEALGSPGTRPPAPAALRRGPPPRRSNGRPALQETIGASHPAPPRPSPPAKHTPTKLYQAVADYVASSTDDSLSLSRGQIVKVLERSTTGWWYVRGEGCLGWAPSTYLVEAAESVAAAAFTPPPPDRAATAVESSTTSVASLCGDLATTTQQQSQLESRLLEQASISPSGGSGASQSPRATVRKTNVSAAAAPTAAPRPSRPQLPPKTGLPPGLQQPAAPSSLAADAVAVAEAAAHFGSKLVVCQASVAPHRPPPPVVSSTANHATDQGQEAGSQQGQQRLPRAATRDCNVSQLVQQLEGKKKA